MITAFILLVVVLLGIYLIAKNYDNYNNEEIWIPIGWFISVCFGIWFIFHVVAISLVSYNYEVWLVERNSFESTINDVRERGNEYETIAMAKDIIEWNKQLVVLQYENTTLYFDQFIDDRIHDLEPIK